MKILFNAGAWRTLPGTGGNDMDAQSALWLWNSCKVLF